MGTVFLFLACPSTKEKESEIKSNEPIEIVEKEPEKKVKRFIRARDTSDVLCTIFGIYNQENQPVEVPKEVEKALECPIINSISPDSRYLLISDGNRIKLLDFTTQKVNTLLSLLENGDGSSNGLWSSDGTKVAFVNVNQEEYAERTMLFVLTINNGQMIKKQKFRNAIHMTCGSYCFSSEGEDFWFIDTETIGYYSENPALEGVNKEEVTHQISLVEG